MKSLVHLVAAAAALSVSLGAIAQTSGQVTRAQVRAELAQLEQAGYRPSPEEPYPAQLEAAEARVHVQDMSGVGHSAVPAVQVGHASGTNTSPRDSIFFGQ
ncbi:DUF4148 domain-containing protein [Burkholderia sp. Bp8963]|uniref:DUF4148 domain-containing protein n=1 Tax=Burkholderia sp. Bp8963 TaxID=2184547 RepID=UPI000F5AEC50|nr:DUF4148 domain-containing protein [Burkholderia sp. Bp8963]RQS68210.1 DUF4148 domain-containing protein [Burkholderia sp. Bp8963]